PQGCRSTSPRGPDGNSRPQTSTKLARVVDSVWGMAEQAVRRDARSVGTPSLGISQATHARDLVYRTLLWRSVLARRGATVIAGPDTADQARLGQMITGNAGSTAIRASLVESVRR